MTDPSRRIGLEVLFVIRTLQFGGAERQLALLARGLHRRGHRVMVLTLYPDGPLAGELVQAGVPVRSLDKRSRWDIAGPIVRAIRLVRRERPAVLHGYLVSGNLFALALRPLVPGARAVWAIRSTMLDFGRYNRFIGITYRIANQLSRRADLIISNSRAGAEDHIAAGYPRARTIVIPNGIDTFRFTPDAERRARTREAWGMSEDDIVVGMVCRIDPMKDHPTFLRAAARASGREPRLRFVCVGNGAPGYREEMRTLAVSLGVANRLQWIPAQVDVPAVYNALDVLCSASAFGEGFSNALGEAMACGVPCVATAVGDASEVIGDVGTVVPVGDDDHLGEALLATAAARSPALSRRCRDRIVEHFGVERLLDATEAALGLTHD